MYREDSGEILAGKNENKTEVKWTEVYTNGSCMEIIISNLPSKTTFVFKVQCITAIGLSAISGLSKPIETLAKKKQKGGKLAYFSYFIIEVCSKHHSMPVFFSLKSSSYSSFFFKISSPADIRTGYLKVTNHRISRTRM
jgi:hypothetical protein